MKHSILLIALASLFAGCSSSNGDSGVTELRVMNLITDSNYVGYEMNEEDYASVSYKSITGFSSVLGSYVVDLELIDADGITSTLVDNKSITMDGDREYTFYAVGTVASADFFVVPAANDDPTEDMAKMQFVNATLEPLTVYVYTQGMIGAGTQYTEMIAARDYQAPVEVPAQSVQIQVEREDGSIAFTSLSFNLQNEWDITFVLTDYLGPGQAAAGVEVLRIEDSGNTVSVPTTGRPASIRYIDALTAQPDIAVTRTDVLQMPNTAYMSFASGSDREIVEPGFYDLTVTPSDNLGGIFFTTSLSLIGGFDYSVVLTGSLGGPESILLVDSDREIVTHSNLSIVVAAESIPEVDIYVSKFGNGIFSGSRLASVPYRTSKSLVLPREVHNLTITSPGSTSILVGPVAIDLTNSASSTVLLHEAENGGTPFGLSVL